MKAEVRFTRYYDFTVDVDGGLWNADPEAAINKALNEAEELLLVKQSGRNAGYGYSDYEVEIYNDDGCCVS